MRRIVVTVAAAALLAGSTIGLAQTTAAAAPSVEAKRYANCTALTKDFPHGVSRSRAAANRQVRNGYGRPAFGKRARAVYAANKGPMDRDKDGTACER